jgi:predicted nuclease of predicted toxin-antitoxin system
VRFLADECCPAQVVSALRAAGHDVSYLLERIPGAADPTAAALAEAEDRVLITEDFDFGELVVRHRVALPGLVILALIGLQMTTRVRRVLETVGQVGEGLRGQITVVEVDRERVRPLSRE